MFIRYLTYKNKFKMKNKWKYIIWMLIIGLMSFITDNLKQEPINYGSLIFTFIFSLSVICFNTIKYERIKMKNL